MLSINVVLICGHRLVRPFDFNICKIEWGCRCGGKCISAEYTDRIGELAKTYGLQLHIDGARIFNASIVRLKICVLVSHLICAFAIS